MNPHETETILIDGEYLSSLINDIEQAKHSIDFEVFIYENDATGRKLADALCAAASRGVNIRVLVDGVGSPDWGNEMTKKMESSGIQTRVYHPLPFIFHHWQHYSFKSGTFFFKLYNLIANMNSRNHRKTCLLDKKTAYVGSVNINDNICVWHELTVRITNTNTVSLQEAFEKAWSGKMPHQVAGPNIFYLNYNWRLRREYFNSLLDRIANCKARAWIINSYFTPDSRLLKSLIQAKKNGADVKILLPHISDVIVSSLAAKTFYHVLLKHQLEIYEYLPSILHAKSLILDDSYRVGSSNLNFRSLRHDLEVDVMIQTQDAKNTLDKLILADIKLSKKMKLEDMENQPLFQYLLGRIILIFRYWL